MDIRIIHGIDLVQLQADVNAATGFKPVGGLVYRNGVFFQALENGTALVPYMVVDTPDDTDFIVRASFQDGAPLGDPLLVRSRIIQAFGRTLNDAVITVDQIGGMGVIGEQILEADTAAEVRALVPTLNLAFRAAFTTTGAEQTQFVTAVNTPQAVTYNDQQLPNAVLGTLNNATGVFTAAQRIVGLMTISAQVRRGLAGAMTYAMQLEGSPDGLVWTPGANRRISLIAGENNATRVYDFTTAIDVPAGTQLRVTQMASDATNNCGIVALAAGVGGVAAAGFVLSIYSTN